MARSSLSPLERQVACVSRRLFVQTVLDALVWCWVGALLLSALWFFVQPFIFEAPPSWLRWAIAGGIVGAASILAIVLAIFRAPSKVAAALSMDERFGLKERITTSMMLAPEQTKSSAGLALLEDVNQRVSKLDVQSGFPFSISRSAVLVPVCAVLFACVAFLYEPSRGQATSENLDAKEAPKDPVAIEQKMDALKKKAEKRAEAKPKSDEIEKLEAKLEEIANRPRSTKDQLRERIKEMTSLENQIKERERQLNEQSLKQQLKQLDKLAQKSGAENGPAKDLQKALAEGNLDKAKDEIERLVKKMKENELSAKEQQQLQQQLKDIEEKLKNLANQKEREDQLKQLNKEGKLDAETLKRELENLKKDSDRLKSMAELAKKLGQCQSCMQSGDGKGAQKSMQEAADELKKMDLDEQDLKDLREQLQRLQDAKDCCQGQCQGKGENGNGMGSGEKPGGKRPVAEEGPFKSFESRNKTEFDSKGKKIFDGYAPGQNFKKKSSTEISGDIEQARQEAPEAIDQQRIPKAAREMAKGYFRNLGGQNDKPPVKENEKP